MYIYVFVSLLYSSIQSLFLPLALSFKLSSFLGFELLSKLANLLHPRSHLQLGFTSKLWRAKCLLRGAISLSLVNSFSREDTLTFPISPPAMIAMDWHLWKPVNPLEQHFWKPLASHQHEQKVHLSFCLVCEKGPKSLQAEVGARTECFLCPKLLYMCVLYM